MTLRSVVIAIGSVVVIVAGVFAWGWFGAAHDCSDPACVRQRFTLDLELDRFERVEPIALEVATEEGPASLTSVIGSGGIDVRMRADGRSLPLAENETLDRVDLYAFAEEWRSRTIDGGVDAHLYAMLAPGIVSDSGEELFGLMFDSADRTGFAVAPAEIARRFQQHESDAVPVLQLRTFIHEMLHALNRRHGEAAQMPGERLTIEAPTRCIAENTQGNHWSLREQPLLSLSPSTIAFFQSAPASRVLPGPGNSPFLFGSPSTCRDVRESIARPLETSRWRLALRRARSLLAFPQAYAAEEVEKALRPSNVELRLQAMTSPYPLGYPIAVRVTAINRGETPLPLVGRLSPGYGIVTVERRRTEQEEWEPIEPLAWYDPIDDTDAQLQPGARTEQSVPIFFDKEAWTFPIAGEYQIRARLHLADDVMDTLTEPVPLRIEAPDTGPDREALRLMSDEEGRLRNDIGRLLLLQGRVRDADGEAIVAELVEKYPDTALGVAMQLARASRMLRRPIDPKTGQRPPPDLRGARELLADSCSDSGIAALRRQLLDFHEDTTGSQAVPAMVESVEAAWDGTMPPGRASIATYSDPALRPVSQVFQFCPETAQLPPATARDAAQLARELRRLQPERVVLVGHSDRNGTCESNDITAMQRAASLRNAFVRAGLDADRITVVSLGKRRPADFTSSPQADALNRRVEVLLPVATAEALAATDLPTTPGPPACSP